MVFDNLKDDPAPKITTVPLGGEANYSPKHLLMPQVGEKPDETLQVMGRPYATLKLLLPNTKDLRFLAHGRRNVKLDSQGDAHLVGKEQAVIIGNRLPNLGHDNKAVVKHIPWQDGARRVINMAALANDGEKDGILQRLKKSGSLPDHEFALQMIEGVDRAQFKRHAKKEKVANVMGGTAPSQCA